MTDPPATFRQLVPALRLALECMRREYDLLYWPARDYAAYGERLAFQLTESRRAYERRHDIRHAMEQLELFVARHAEELGQQAELLEEDDDAGD